MRLIDFALFSTYILIPYTINSYSFKIIFISLRCGFHNTKRLWVLIALSVLFCFTALTLLHLVFLFFLIKQTLSSLKYHTNLNILWPKPIYLCDNVWLATKATFVSVYVHRLSFFASYLPSTIVQQLKFLFISVLFIFLLLLVLFPSLRADFPFVYLSSFLSLSLHFWGWQQQRNHIFQLFLELCQKKNVWHEKKFIKLSFA